MFLAKLSRGRVTVRVNSGWQSVCVYLPAITQFQEYKQSEKTQAPSLNAASAISHGGYNVWTLSTTFGGDHTQKSIICNKLITNISIPPWIPLHMYSIR